MRHLLTFLTAFSLIFMVGCAATREVREEPGITLREAEKVTVEHVGPRRKVAVIDFIDKTKYGQARLGTAASDILITELGKADRFILVEREKLDKILEEQELKHSGHIDPAQVAKAGKLLGINAIVTGSISAFGVHTEGSNCLLYGYKKQVAEATIDVRVVDVETGEIIHAETGSGAAATKYTTILGIGTSGGYDETLGHKAIRAAIVKFARNLIYQIDQKVHWYCRVAEVSEGKIYLDAGRESNLKPGSILNVQRPGKEIRSPETGMVIGRVETEIGTIQIIDYFGDNGSIAKIVSGTQPATGDYARFE